jgi:hypothetical protein
MSTPARARRIWATGKIFITPLPLCDKHQGVKSPGKIF